MLTLNNPTKFADQSAYFVSSNPCPSCDEVLTISVKPEQLFAYNQGGYAQDILSDYSLEVRERFISGYCDDCWKNIFGDEDF
jgi:hypothetical protein